MFETSLKTPGPLYFLKVELNTSSNTKDHPRTFGSQAMVSSHVITSFLCKSHLYSRFHIDGHLDPRMQG